MLRNLVSKIKIADLWRDGAGAQQAVQRTGG